MVATPSISGLYRLPFSKNDNPNGWIEITTHCNLLCPNCYRGCNRDDFSGNHESLEKIKGDILELVRIRNCQIISISGGEPLLHPQIMEIIKFIHQRMLNPWLHTNGLLLSENKLVELKMAGLKGLIIRVDSLSNPDQNLTEKDLNNKRHQFAEMVAKVGGVHLSFISVVNRDNIKQIPDALLWAQANSQLIDFMAIIPMRGVKFTHDDVVDTDKWIYLDDLCKVFEEKIPGISYASYLGSQSENDTIRWLQAIWMVLDGKVLGYFKPKMVELFQMLHHLRYGKYAYRFGKGRSKINFLQLLFIAVFLKEARKIRNRFLIQIIKNPINLFRSGNIQLMCYIIPPGNTNRLHDICDGCPDAILYKGKLYPSCGLEEIKLNETEINANWSS